MVDGHYAGELRSTELAAKVANLDTDMLCMFPERCCCCLQLGVGTLYFLPLWATGLRKAPKLAKGSMKNLR
jgi:hypothetical protein